MSPSTNQEIEARGANVEAAIDAGLRRLGMSRDQVAVTVVDEGSRGLLGIGSREAVVRLKAVAVTPPAPPPARPAAPPPPPPPAPARPPLPARPEPPTQREQPQREQPPARPAPPPAPPPSVAATPPPAAAAEDEAAAPATADELAAEGEAAVEVLSELLDKMHVTAQVSVSQSEPDDLTGQRVNVVAINGEDLTMLIGPRGETLDALQFLGRLMVAHKLHRRANFVVDVEGYRQRRVQALTRLAERMADKARQRGEPISLEPMTAYERRIIHMALRDVDDVSTESAGEGKQRRVRIYPK
jgi:spoIIIJ-associated protein